MMQLEQKRRNLRSCTIFLYKQIVSLAGGPGRLGDRYARSFDVLSRTRPGEKKKLGMETRDEKVLTKERKKIGMKNKQGLRAITRLIRV